MDSSNTPSPAHRSFDKARVVFRPAKTSEFWVLIKHGDQKMPALKQKPAASNYFLVTKGTDAKPLKRYFELVGHYLVARESADKVPIDYLNLSYLHIYLIKEHNTKRNLMLYILRLTNIQVFDNLITTDERLAQKWYFLLMRHCVGIRVADFYELYPNRQLGQGQYGSVHLARFKSGGALDDRAIKVYRKEEIFQPDPKDLGCGKFSPEDERKFKLKNTIRRKAIVEEINILRKLDCPHLLKLHEVYEDHDSDQICIVTQAYFGGSLSDRINKKPNSRFSIWDCLQITQRILEGLEYLHDFRIIHRDLKPDNIVFHDSDGSYDLAIIDFGFATHEDDYKKLFVFCGTPGYMAPEVLNRQHYDCRADMFAVGVIFYRMLTGHGPFTAKTSPGGKSFEQRVLDASPIYDWKELEMEITEKQSALLVDFMKRLITQKAETRMRPREALAHELFSLLQVKSSTVEQHTSPKKSLLEVEIERDKGEIVAEGNPQVTSEDEDEEEGREDDQPILREEGSPMKMKTGLKQK